MSATTRSVFRGACTLGVLLSLAVSVTACDEGGRTTVVTRSSQEETTGTLTPVERGRIRREALDVVRAAIAAWQDSDLESMKEYFAPELVAKFEKAWEPYRAKNQHVVHVHEVDYLDMIEMNNAGTQALVTYRYNDDSYVADAAGNKIEDLPPFELKELQFTLQLENGQWKIIRSIGGEDAYR